MADFREREALFLECLLRQICPANQKTSKHARPACLLNAIFDKFVQQNRKFPNVLSGGGVLCRQGLRRLQPAGDLRTSAPGGALGPRAAGLPGGKRPKRVPSMCGSPAVTRFFLRPLAGLTSPKPKVNGITLHTPLAKWCPFFLFCWEGFRFREKLKHPKPGRRFPFFPKRKSPEDLRNGSKPKL